MVLKAKNAQVPGFETDSDTAVMDAPAAAPRDEQEASIPLSKLKPVPVTSQPSAEATASTAIAKAASTSLAKPLKFGAALSDFENALPDVEFGTFPRVIVDLGGFEMDKEVLGITLKMEMMSWAYRYVISPGSDDKEANALVKYSNDGINLNDGGSVADYLNMLKTVHGYTDAAKKTYIDLTGILLETDGEAFPEDEQVIVQVQLSSQSVKQFNGYRITKGVMEARKGAGATTGNILTLIRTRGEYNTKKFAYVMFK